MHVYNASLIIYQLHYCGIIHVPVYVITLDSLQIQGARNANLMSSIALGVHIHFRELLETSFAESKKKGSLHYD